MSPYLFVICMNVLSKMIDKEDILHQFPFGTGSLPVRYLGLPLLTKSMTVLDFLPLIEIIRKMINSWKNRILSYAGRLQLINSVIISLSNFWMAAFRLPNACIKEVEKFCSVFLWSGPELNGKKARVSWADVCRPKQDGGLGVLPYYLDERIGPTQDRRY